MEQDTISLSWDDIPDEQLNFVSLITPSKSNTLKPTEKTIEVLKKRLPLVQDIVRDLVRETDESLKGPCPKCGGVDRFVYKITKDWFHCRKCNTHGGDVIDFHQWLYDCTIADLKKQYISEETTPFKEPTFYPCPAKEDEQATTAIVDNHAEERKNKTDINANEVWERAKENASNFLDEAKRKKLYEYLNIQRKIPEHVIDDAIKQDRLCYSSGRFHPTVGQKFNPSAVFKYETINGETRTVQVVDLESVDKPKVFFKGLKTRNAFFFAGRSFNEADTVCVVEAPINALSGAAVLPGMCWTAIGSSMMVKSLGDMRGHDKTFVLALDCDEAGQKGTEGAANVLAGENVKAVKWPEGTPKGYDLNDLLMAGQEEEIRGVIEQAVPVVPEKSSTDGKVVFVSLREILANPCEQVPIISGVNYEGDALLIHGGGGTGKSLWAMQVALELASCSPEHPSILWGRLEIPKPRTTLFLQSENNNAVIFNRISRMIQGRPVFKRGVDRIFFIGSSNQRPFLTGQYLDNKGFLEKLQKQIDIIESAVQRRPDILIVDPLVSFHGGDENDNPGMRRVLDTIMGFCDQSKITPWIIHHDGKNGDSRGASAIHDWTRSRVHLKPKREARRNIIEVIHEKSNNTKRFESFHLEIDEKYLLFDVVDYTGGPSKKDLKERENLELVYKAVKNMGGRATNKAEILKSLTFLHSIPKTTATRYINMAINKRYIIEQENEFILSPHDKI